MRRKWFILVLIFAIVTLACGFFGNNDDNNATSAEAPEVVEAPQSDSSPSEPEVEQPIEEMEAPVPSSGSDAPMYFTDEFDGDTMDTNWFTEYSYFVDEDVEEDDPEYTPSYSIEQRRGALRFEIDSPYLYLYQIYGPHMYDEVRIDFEVENKGVNTNNVGAICRYTDYGWYEFITTSGGYYSIMRYYEDGNKELATGGIKSIRFGEDKKNVYTMICTGRTLILEVNGVEIARVKDEEIPDAGYAGINISSEGVVPVQVEVNWLQISQP